MFQSFNLPAKRLEYDPTNPPPSVLPALRVAAGGEVSQPSPQRGELEGGEIPANPPAWHVKSGWRDPYFWLTLLLSLPVVGPLLQPGYFWGAHDARPSVYFLYEFNKSIRDGLWYPRWSPDFAFGYGYPFFNVYGPLSSYVGEAFHLAGLDIVTSVKVVFGLAAVLSGLTMYLFARRLMGPAAGLLAGLVYVYLPYHIFDMYVRAALAESVAFVFVPLVLWGFYETAHAPRLRAIVGAALAFAGLTFTSFLLSFLFTLAAGLYVLLVLYLRFNDDHPRWWARLASLGAAPVDLVRRGWPSALALAWGVGLSAIFLFPVLVESQYVNQDQWVGGRYAFGDDFVEVFQLFSPRWGFGASIPGPNDEAGFQIGLVPLVLFALSFLIVPRLADRSLRRTLYFMQGMALFVAFLTTPLSAPLWFAFPIVTIAQFPWRLLALMATPLAVVAGIIVAGQRSGGVEEKLDAEAHEKGGEDTSPPRLPGSPTSLLTLVALALLIILGSYPYLRAEVREPLPTEGPVSQAALFRFQQSADEMTGVTAWVRRIPGWSTLAETVVRGGTIETKVVYDQVWDETVEPPVPLMAAFSMEMDSVHELLWVFAADERQAVTFHIPYYPGWTAYLYRDLGPDDGELYGRIGPLVTQPAITTTPDEGWMVVPLPPGRHFLELRFEDTPVRVVGTWLSVLSLLAIAAALGLRRFIAGVTA